MYCVGADTFEGSTFGKSGNMSNEADNRESLVPDLYRDTYSDLTAFLIRRLKDRELARDIAQEAFLRLLRVERKDLIEQPKAYLFRIATNLIYEIRMKERRASGAEVSVDFLEEVAEPICPEKKAEDREAIRHLARIVSDLPPLYGAILLMRKRDGLSHAEIAKKLNISTNTVHKYLTRALIACRKATLADN